MNQVTNTQISDTDWKCLYKVGGMAALIAGVLFKRNIAAEIELFIKQEPPITVSDQYLAATTEPQKTMLLAAGQLAPDTYD